MNRTLIFLSIVVYSIFVGSQITEGVLLVPFWKALPHKEFYTYYASFGPVISQFYTAMTITATLIPFRVSIYCFSKKSNALKYSIISTFFALFVIALFYLYFKDTNQQLYEASFNENQLKYVLRTWGYWHWARVIAELLSLIYMLITFDDLLKERN